jgi:hypothetical protein
MIPSSILARRVAFDQDWGSIPHSLFHLRGPTLTALLDDLVVAEMNGLDDQTECKSVREILGMLVNSASGLGGGFWIGVLHKDLEEFLDLYRKWNSHAGPEAPKLRAETLRDLRNTRRRFTEKAGQYRGILSNELDKELFENVFKAIEHMCRQYPDKFPSLAKAVRNYRKGMR